MNVNWFRQPHIMHSNKLTTVPKHFTSVACTYEKHSSEIDKAYHWYTLKQCALQFWLFAVDKWYTNDVVVFDCIEDAWIYLAEIAGKRSKHYVVSPNLAQDLSVLGFSNQLTLGNIKRDWECLINPPTIVDFTYYNGANITAVDLRNFISKWPCNYTVFAGNSKDEFDVSLKEHLENEQVKENCTACAKAFANYLDFIRQNDLGNFRPTVGGQAFNAFKHRFMHDKIMLHGHKEAVKLERQAFRGGRCEAFYYGKYTGKVYAIDCNGLYPYAMLHGNFPIKAIDHEKFPSMSNPIFDRSNVEIVGRVQISSERRCYPTVDRGIVRFASGKFTTALCGREFREAWESGHIISVGEYVAYLAAPIFKDYIEYFWGLREKYKASGDNDYEQLAKAFMVSLFGKFGQKHNQWVTDSLEWKIEEMGQWPIVNADTGEIQIARSLDNYVEIQHKDGETDDSFPAISACVTSYSRWYMDHVIDCIGRNTVLMQYIDSLLLTQDGYDAVIRNGAIMGDSIGQFKLTGEYDGCCIRSSYDYDVGDNHKICGIPKEARIDSLGNVVYGVKETENSLINSEGNGRFTIRDISGRLNRNRPVNYAGSDGWLAPIRIEE